MLLVSANQPPEGNWREISGWEGKYYVSDAGDVWSRHSGRVLASQTDSVGYKRVTLAGRHIVRIHRLVATAFLEQTGPLVRHLDGDKSNNRLDNLAWGTSSDNTRDSIRHGTFRHWNSLKTECKRGHPFTEENTHIQSDGARLCLTCKRGKVYPSAQRRGKQEKAK